MRKKDYATIEAMCSRDALCGSRLASYSGPDVRCTKKNNHKGKCFGSIECQDDVLLCLEWHFVELKKSRKG